jgi:hypothetical protein
MFEGMFLFLLLKSVSSWENTNPRIDRRLSENFSIIIIYLKILDVDYLV